MRGGNNFNIYGVWKTVTFFSILEVFFPFFIVFYEILTRFDPFKVRRRGLYRFK